MSEGKHVLNSSRPTLPPRPWYWRHVILILPTLVGWRGWDEIPIFQGTLAWRCEYLVLSHQTSKRRRSQFWIQVWPACPPPPHRDPKLLFFCLPFVSLGNPIPLLFYNFLTYHFGFISFSSFPHSQQVERSTLPLGLGHAFSLGVIFGHLMAASFPLSLVEKHWKPTLPLLSLGKSGVSQRVWWGKEIPVQWEALLPHPASRLEVKPADPSRPSMQDCWAVGLCNFFFFFFGLCS